MDDQLEERRKRFFEDKRRDLDAGEEPLVWPVELARLWPDGNGGLDSRAAEAAFFAHNMHYAGNEFSDDAGWLVRPTSP